MTRIIEIISEEDVIDVLKHAYRYFYIALRSNDQKTVDKACTEAFNLIKPIFDVPPIALGKAIILRRRAEMSHAATESIKDESDRLKKDLNEPDREELIFNNIRLLAKANELSRQQYEDAKDIYENLVTSPSFPAFNNNYICRFIAANELVRLHEIGLYGMSPEKAIAWRHQAAKGGCPQASLDLAKTFMTVNKCDKGNLVAAKNLMEQALKQSRELPNFIKGFGQLLPKEMGEAYIIIRTIKNELKTASEPSCPNKDAVLKRLSTKSMLMPTGTGN